MRTALCIGLIAIAGITPFIASGLILSSILDTGEQYQHQYSTSEQYFQGSPNFEASQFSEQFSDGSDHGTAQESNSEEHSVASSQSSTWSDYGVDVDSLSIDAGYRIEY